MIRIYLIYLILVANTVSAQQVLYGTTFGGGTKNAGTIFRINSDGTDFETMYNLDPNTDGEEIWGSLLLVDEFLYGHSFKNGPKKAGTIFRISTEGTFQVLHQFDSINDGYKAMGSLIRGSNGFLYGMTNEGGTNNNGTIYRLNPDGSDFLVLKHFSKATDGGNPYGRLVEGIDKKLYGMTSSGTGGNISNSGAIFRMNLDGSDFEVLRFLSIVDGQAPFGSLIFSSGILYGMTRVGGPGPMQGNTYYAFGNIFSLNPQNLEFKLLHSLNPDLEGGNPYGNIIETSNGRLVGMTRYGQMFNGSVFSLKKDGSDFKVLHKFTVIGDGSMPRGDLIETHKETLLGLTYEGGEYNAGTIFKIGLDGSGFTVLRSFNPATEGKNPRGSFVLGALITKTMDEDIAVSVYPNPSSEMVHISSDVIMKEVSIFDLNGKKIYSDVMIKILDVKLSTGLYIVRILIGKNTVTKKISIIN